MARPYFKALSDKALIEAYFATKQLAYTGAQLKSPRLGGLLRDLDLIVAIARKRGLRLAATAPTAEAAVEFGLEGRVSP